MLVIREKGKTHENETCVSSFKWHHLTKVYVFAHFLGNATDFFLCIKGGDELLGSRGI